MQNIDHLRSYGIQYERMLNEYGDFMAAASAKLSREPRVDADSIDDLRQQLTSLSVSHHVLSTDILLQMN